MRADYRATLSSYLMDRCQNWQSMVIAGVATDVHMTMRPLFESGLHLAAGRGPLVPGHETTQSLTLWRRAWLNELQGVGDRLDLILWMMAVRNCQ